MAKQQAQSESLIPIDLITSKILFVRNEKILLDKDLAELYGVETRVLNQAVKRNISRFPDDFMFQLSIAEYRSLRSQFVTLKRGAHQSICLMYSRNKVLQCYLRFLIVRVQYKLILL